MHEFADKEPVRSAPDFFHCITPLAIESLFLKEEFARSHHFMEENDLLDNVLACSLWEVDEPVARLLDCVVIREVQPAFSSVWHYSNPFSTHLLYQP
jgi:hypothetical protein